MCQRFHTEHTDCFQHAYLRSSVSSVTAIYVILLGLVQQVLDHLTWVSSNAAASAVMHIFDKQS